MITVVNIIPKALSYETEQDSEPNLAVNPANPMQIVASAFTPNPDGHSNAPIFVSNDGGNTWVLNFIVPSESVTFDITLRFSGSGTNLYASIIRYSAIHNDPPRLNILRTTNPTGATAMKVLVDRKGAGVDQPYVQAAVNNGVNPGKDI